MQRRINLWNGQNLLRMCCISWFCEHVNESSGRMKVFVLDQMINLMSLNERKNDVVIGVRIFLLLNSD
jgi:hypothetical protein